MAAAIQVGQFGTPPTASARCLSPLHIGGAAPADRQAGDPSLRTPLMMTPDVAGDRLW
jgi:hypothetical protein